MEEDFQVNPKSRRVSFMLGAPLRSRRVSRPNRALQPTAGPCASVLESLRRYVPAAVERERSAEEPMNQFDEWVGSRHIEGGLDGLV